MSRSQNCDDLTVVIPVKNEVNNIRDVIEGLLQNYPNLNIIVPVDYSTDGTVDAIAGIQRYSKNIALLDRKNEKIKGLTVSILDAIEIVRTKYFIVMDGDGQHDVKYVQMVYNQLKLNSKLCVASRIAVPGWPIRRRMLSLIGAFLGKSVLFLKRKKSPSDILSGFFGVETDYWMKVTRGRRDFFLLKGYKILFDFLKICDCNIDIKNVYYVFDTRSSGSSKMNWKIYVEYLKSLLL